MAFADRAESRDLPEKLGALADLLERKGIKPEDIGKVNRISAWQTGYKDADGEARTLDLVGIQLSPSWDDGPQWPVVQPAKPVTVKSRRANAKGKLSLTTLRTALLVPDSQVGYIGDEPMHDEQALTLVVEMARNPDITDVVILGDMLDLAGMSRFGGPPTLTQRVQPAIDRLHEFLAQLRAAAPNATFSYLAGNHEERMAKTLAANAAEAFGLRRAGIPDSWPVLSPPYLLRLDELGVRYHGGYPAGAVWLRDDIKILHGKRTTAERASKDNIAGVSQFFGHTHRLEVKSKSVESTNGTILSSLHVSCGTLARIDGTVPSFGSGSDDSGRPVRSVEDWQQGCVVLTFDADEVGTPPTVELVPFHNGSALWRGKAYRA
jgi:hypothetical protein